MSDKTTREWGWGAEPEALAWVFEKLGVALKGLPQRPNQNQNGILAQQFEIYCIQKLMQDARPLRLSSSDRSLRAALASTLRLRSIPIQKPF